MLDLKNTQTKGYDEIKSIDNRNIFVVFAIKMENDVYQTYYYEADEQYIEQAEDYEKECIETFASMEAALNHLKFLGADIHQFKPFKGCKPF